MAKRGGATRRSNGGTKKASASGDAMEQRVMAFAEQLGRMVGTVHAKAEGWMDRETLNKQIASVRDGASELLEHLKRPAKKTKKTKKRSASAAAVARARGSARGRSGGVVDAPGKKHRRPAPADPRAKVAGGQQAKGRVATPAVRLNRRGARG